MKKKYFMLKLLSIIIAVPPKRNTLLFIFIHYTELKKISVTLLLIYFSLINKKKLIFVITYLCCYSINIVQIFECRNMCSTYVIRHI